MGAAKRSFGATVRAARQEKGISLRKFADMVGVSATFVSMIERDEIQSTRDDQRVVIKEETIDAIAEALDLDRDNLLALAGKVPTDLSGIIHKHPQEIAALLRSVKNLPPEEIDRITKRTNQGKK